MKVFGELKFDNQWQVVAGNELVGPWRNFLECGDRGKCEALEYLEFLGVLEPSCAFFGEENEVWRGFVLVVRRNAPRSIVLLDVVVVGGFKLECVSDGAVEFGQWRRLSNSEYWARSDCCLEQQLRSVAQFSTGSKTLSTHSSNWLLIHVHSSFHHKIIHQRLPLHVEVTHHQHGRYGAFELGLDSKIRAHLGDGGEKNCQLSEFYVSTLLIEQKVSVGDQNNLSSDSTAKSEDLSNVLSI